MNLINRSSSRLEEASRNDAYILLQAEERGEVQLPMANRAAYSHILFQDYDPMDNVNRSTFVNSQPLSTGQPLSTVNPCQHRTVVNTSNNG